MRLVVATEAEQRARDEVTFSAWGGGLTLPQFLAREQVLRAHPWAARTMTTWLWCAEDGAVLASCESFVDEARVGAQVGTAATIASVFTVPELRGRGYAAELLRAVVAALGSRAAVPGVASTDAGSRDEAPGRRSTTESSGGEARAQVARRSTTAVAGDDATARAQLARRSEASGVVDGPCLAVTLFSEIGTGLYQRLGFWPVPAFDTWFDGSPTPPDVDAWLHDSLSAPQHAPADASTLRLTLDAQRLDWQLARERFYAAALARPPLDVHGARVGESTITWTAYWKTNELQVLSLDVRRESDVARLIDAARFAAMKAGLPRVRVWETRSLSHLEGAQRSARTDEIAMFCPLAPGLQAWTEVERGLWA